MENKITLPALSAMLAQRTGLTKRLCEDFVRELFALVSSSLVEGESVKINDLGTFRVAKVEPRMSVDVVTGESIQIPGHRKVVFLPDKELAAVINEPFEAFEPVELPDEMELPDQSDQSDLSDQSDQSDLSDQSYQSDQSDLFYDLSEQEKSPEEPAALPEEEPAEIPAEEPAVFPAEKPAALPEEEPAEMPAEEPVVSTAEAPVLSVAEAPVVSVAEEPVVSVVEEAPVREVRIVEKDGRRFGIGFLIGFICCLIVFGVIGLIGYRTLLSKIESMQPVEIPEIVVADGTQDAAADANVAYANADEQSAAESAPENEGVSGQEVAPTAQNEQNRVDGQKELAPETKPSDKKVYDTISRTRFLTTMAKEHYGNFNLWPYIYEENKAFLGHPDRIRPGTRVVVPPLSKYGVNPNSKADIEKARRMGAEIYARYQ